MQGQLKLGLGIFLFVLCSNLFANEAQNRVELMKFAIKMESTLPHETEWNEVSWFEKFKLIEEAYAYKEGETCLVLGFKSQFKNGMCRLSIADGIKDYKNKCPKSTLPCNPNVFGKASADKPFCVSQNLGKDLSKFCAKETFSLLAKITNAPELKDIPKSSPANFDLNKINFSSMSPTVSKTFDSIFNHDDATLDSAISFTESLCNDLKVVTKTGHQPMDLKTCESHLALLKKGKVPSSEKAIAKEKSPVVIAQKKIATVKDEECIIPQTLEKSIQENIKDVKQVTNHSESAALLNCVNKIEAHKVVAPKLVGIADFAKERDRYFGYWHQMDGEKKFGRMCEENSTNDNAVFNFVGPKGFSMVNVPATNFKNGVSRISSNGKEYYLIRDAFGDYFELIAKDKVSSAPPGSQEDIRIYLKKGGAAINHVTTVPAANFGQAKLCIRERLDEYLDWITYPTGVLPNVLDYNKDIGIYNSSHSDPKARAALINKYKRSVDEIKKEEFEKAMKDLPDCKEILSEEDFSKQYDKDHEEVIKLYLKFREILKLK